MPDTDRRDSFELVHEIEIDASPELVFPFFTDPELLERWFCVHAESDPQPGGRFTFNVTSEDVMRGPRRRSGTGLVAHASGVGICEFVPSQTRPAPHASSRLRTPEKKGRTT